MDRAVRKRGIDRQCRRRTQTEGKIGLFFYGVLIGAVSQWWSILFCISCMKHEAYEYATTTSYDNGGSGEKSNVLSSSDGKNKSYYEFRSSEDTHTPSFSSSSLLHAEDSSLTIKGIALVSLSVFLWTILIREIFITILELKTGRRINVAQSSYLMVGAMVGAYVVASFAPFGLYSKQMVQIFGIVCFGTLSIWGFVGSCISSSWQGSTERNSKFRFVSSFVRNILMYRREDQEEEINYDFNLSKTKLVNLNGKIVKLHLRERSPSPDSFSIVHSHDGRC